MRKHRQLETVLTVCRGTTDPRHPHTGRATEATDNSQVPDPAQDSTGKQPATPRAWAFLSPDSLELGPRFEAGCGHPPEPLDSAPRRPWVPRWEGAREPQVHKLAVSAWVTGFTTSAGRAAGDTRCASCRLHYSPRPAKEARARYPVAVQTFTPLFPIIFFMHLSSLIRV